MRDEEVQQNLFSYDHNIQLDFIVSGCRKAPTGKFLEQSWLGYEPSESR
jgi:hypothetical protein